MIECKFKGSTTRFEVEHVSYNANFKSSYFNSFLKTSISIIVAKKTLPLSSF